MGADDEVRQLQEFMCDVRQQLGEIVGTQKMLLNQCEPRQKRLENVDKTAQEALSSTKSAHHRLDDIEKERKELKDDLKEIVKNEVQAIYRTIDDLQEDRKEIKEELGDTVKREIQGIYRTATIIGAILGTTAGIGTSVIMAFVK